MASLADPPLLVSSEDPGLSASRYQQFQRLGEGAFGEVRLAVDGSTGRSVAIKSVKLIGSNGKSSGFDHNANLPKAVFREITALRQLDHPSIVRLVDVFPSSAALCLVMEYLPMDLSTVISNSHKPIPSDAVKSIAFMVASALAYCHDAGVVHRDIKPANLLLSFQGSVKLADFGLARVIGSSAADLSFQVATRWYRAPELLYASRSYDFKVDIWALGTVLAELLTLSPLFPGNNDIDQMVRVFTLTGTPTEDLYPGCSDLPDYNKISFSDMKPKSLAVFIPQASKSEFDFLSRCIQLCPQLRASAQELMTSDYFTKELPLKRSPSDLGSLFSSLSKPDPIDGSTTGVEGKYTLDKSVSKDSYASMNSNDVQALLNSFLR